MDLPKNYIPYSIKSIALLLLTFVLFAGLALSAFAQESYLYVNQNDNLSSVQAATPTEAIVKADNIKSDSGVITSASFDALSEGSVLGINDTMSPMTSSPSNPKEIYAYVTDQGDMAYVGAEDPADAIETAPNIKSNSGVMLVTE